MDHRFFDQPENLPLVFHVDACMMAFDHAKKLLWYTLYSKIRELMNLPVHDKLLFDCYRCNCWYWRWDLHGLMLILMFPFTFMSTEQLTGKVYWYTRLVTRASRAYQFKKKNCFNGINFINYFATLFSRVNATIQDTMLVCPSIGWSITSIFDPKFCCFKACRDLLLPLPSRTQLR